MNTAEVRAKLIDNMDAFNREGTAAVERIPSLYADDIVFQDPIQTVKGLGPFMETNRRMMARARALDVEIVDAFESGEQIFIGWKMRYVPKVGPAIAIDGCSHCRVRDGRIVYHRDYWDLLGSVMDALPIVAPVYKMLVKQLG
jgi:ketosteroid isomerase-like protein